jgi:HK97 family phage prohead protease
MLWHSNRHWPIGHAEQWRHDDDGVYGVWRLNDSDDAQRAAKMADDGDLRGMSIGFQPQVSEPPEIDEDDRVRIVRKESRLLEVSLTPTPVFDQAEVHCVRTAFVTPSPRRREVDEWWDELERLRVDSP